MNEEGLLSVEQIAAGLEAIGIPYKIQALKQPNSKQIFDLYKKLVISQWNVTEDEMKRPYFQTPDGWEEMTELQNGFLFMNVFDALSRLLGYHGRHQYDLSDIIYPTERSVREMITILFNFARFRQQKIHYIEQQDEDRQKLIDSNDKLELEIEKLKKEIDVHRKRTQERDSNVESMENEIRSLQNKIADTEQAKEFMVEAAKASIEKKIEREKVLKEKRIEAEALMKELKKLQIQSSKSPEETQLALEQAQERLKNEVERNEQKRVELNREKARNSMLAETRDKVISLLDIAIPIANEAKKLSEIAAEEEKLKELIEMRNKRAEAVKSLLAKHKEVVAEKEREGAERKEVIRSLKEQRLATKQEIDEHQRRVFDIVDEIRLIRSKASEYADKMLSELETL